MYGSQNTFKYPQTVLKGLTAKRKVNVVVQNPNSFIFAFMSILKTHVTQKQTLVFREIQLSLSRQ